MTGLHGSTTRMTGFQQSQNLVLKLMTWTHFCHVESYISLCTPPSLTPKSFQTANAPLNWLNPQIVHLVRKRYLSYKQVVPRSSSEGLCASHALAQSCIHPVPGLNSVQSDGLSVSSSWPINGAVLWYVTIHVVWKLFVGNNNKAVCVQTNCNKWKHRGCWCWDEGELNCILNNGSMYLVKVHPRGRCRHNEGHLRGPPSRPG